MSISNSRKLVLADENEQLAFAAQVEAQLAQYAKQGPDTSFIIFLEGDLGTGKTTFARGFILASGFDGVVKSPTYTLVESYPIQGGRTCYHFDLYRLTDPEELEFTGARDCFNDKDVCLVEWPEKAAGFLPKPDWILSLGYGVQDDNEGSYHGRDMTLTACTEKGSRVMLQVFSNF